MCEQNLERGHVSLPLQTFHKCKMPPPPASPPYRALNRPTGYLAHENTPLLGPYSRTLPRVLW